MIITHSNFYQNQHRIGKDSSDISILQIRKVNGGEPQEPILIVIVGTVRAVFVI